MTIRQALNALKQKLNTVTDGEIEARYILEKTIGIPYSDMLFRYNELISEEKYYDKVYGYARYKL